MLFQRLLAIGIEVCLLAETVVSLALGDQPLGVLAIDIDLVGLTIGRERATDIRTLVPINTHPLQVVE
jgi:hypothetical protein